MFSENDDSDLYLQISTLCKKLVIFGISCFINLTENLVAHKFGGDQILYQKGNKKVNIYCFSIYYNFHVKIPIDNTLTVVTKETS